MGGGDVLHSAVRQPAASLPAGTSSSQEVTARVNKILNTFQIDHDISCTFNTAGGWKAGADRPGDKIPTPELLLAVFLVHYSNSLDSHSPGGTITMLWPVHLHSTDQQFHFRFYLTSLSNVWLNLSDDLEESALELKAPN